MIALKKELKRKTAEDFLYYHKKVIVELVPGDVIRLRLLGQRVSSSVSIRIQDLYFDLMRREAARKRAEKRKARIERKRNR